MTLILKKPLNNTRKKKRPFSNMMRKDANKLSKILSNSYLHQLQPHKPNPKHLPNASPNNKPKKFSPTLTFTAPRKLGPQQSLMKLSLPFTI